MALITQRLKAVSVNSKFKPGYHSDGGGLYLQVQKSGAKSWIFCYMHAGKSREMGLGRVADVSLKEAREKASKARNQLREGVDPIIARDALRRAQEVAEARGITFDQCAEQYIAAHKTGWRNAKHAGQWTNTLKTYASPVFGGLPVQVVDTPLVMKVLGVLWNGDPATGTRPKTETATRVRGTRG